MRLRSLPLSLAGVCLGMALAASDYRISWKVALLVMLTTCCLQILSNISNELGDALSGVDTADRKGPQYSIGEGGLTFAAEVMRSYIARAVEMLSEYEASDYRTALANLCAYIAERDR